MAADIGDIHRKLHDGELINATEAILYAQHHSAELRRTVDSLRGIAAFAVADEREACAAKAREYAAHYPEGSDGRHTFILLAEWIENRANSA